MTDENHLTFQQERELVMNSFATDTQLDHALSVKAGWSNLEKALVKYSQGLIKGQTHKFSTYYTWWAKQGITSKIADGSKEN